jgi:hypothetical protein
VPTQHVEHRAEVPGVVATPWGVPRYADEQVECDQNRKPNAAVEVPFEWGGRLRISEHSIPES